MSKKYFKTSIDNWFIPFINVRAIKEIGDNILITMKDSSGSDFILSGDDAKLFMDDYLEYLNKGE